MADMTDEQWAEFQAEMRRGFVEEWLNRYPRLRDDPEMSRRCAAVMAALYDFGERPTPAEQAPSEQELDDADYILSAAKEQIDFVRKMNQPGAWEAALVAMLGSKGGDA